MTLCLRKLRCSSENIRSPRKYICAPKYDGMSQKKIDITMFVAQNTIVHFFCHTKQFSEIHDFFILDVNVVQND